jgi:hypothetical protein
MTAALSGFAIRSRPQAAGPPNRSGRCPSLKVDRPGGRYAFACESRKSPKQVKPTITASMKYCDREAFRTLS